MPKQGIPVNREKIKNLRTNLGLTQTELGSKAMEEKEEQLVRFKKREQEERENLERIAKEAREEDAS